MIFLFWKFVTSFLFSCINLPIVMYPNLVLERWTLGMHNMCLGYLASTSKCRLQMWTLYLVIGKELIHEQLPLGTFFFSFSILIVCLDFVSRLSYMYLNDLSQGYKHPRFKIFSILGNVLGLCFEGKVATHSLQGVVLAYFQAMYSVLV